MVDVPSCSYLLPAGLVTFRETALLFSEEEGSAQNLQRVVVVVAHELAHMWFGELAVACAHASSHVLTHSNTRRQLGDHVMVGRSVVE